MALETATYLGSLVTNWPLGSDQRSTADDHFRLIKGTLTRTFPNIDAEVSASAGELNYLKSASWNIQAQINAFKEGSLNGSTVSGTVHFAMSAGNTNFLGGISASQFARKDIPEAFNAGMAVTGKDLGTLSGTLNIEPTSSNYFTVVLGGNVTNISLGTAITFGHVLSIRFQQDGTGGNVVTGWPGSVVWADGSTFAASTTASAIDFITMVWDTPLSVWLAAPRKYG